MGTTATRKATVSRNVDASTLGRRGQRWRGPSERRSRARRQRSPTCAGRTRPTIARSRSCRRSRGASGCSTPASGGRWAPSRASSAPGSLRAQPGQHRRAGPRADVALRRVLGERRLASREAGRVSGRRRQPVRHDLRGVHQPRRRRRRPASRRPRASTNPAARPGSSSTCASRSHLASAHFARSDPANRQPWRLRLSTALVRM